jgi:uncharacterized membrane protein
MKRRRLLVHLRSSLWFVPVLCVLAGAGIAVGTIALDRFSDYKAVPQSLVGDPAAARAILSTVAVAMVSLTTLVLTITMVVVQLAMGQFSPRIVQRILRDKPSQFAIGLFVATFVQAILALREVTDNGDGTGHVPGITILTTFLLVLASIAVLVIYVQHLGQALRVSALIELVGNETRTLVDKLYPDKGENFTQENGEPRIVRARESGVVTVVGSDQLVAEALRAGCALELIPALGEFVPADAPLFRIHGNPVGLDENSLHEALILKLEPTLDQDISYGIRLLVDIAERSLSESPFQDPTTAVQAIDRLHDILRQLVRRPFPDGRHRDVEGEVRLIVPSMSWEEFVLLAFEEIRLAGASSPQVTRRVRAALTDLKLISPPERVGVIDRQLELLDTSVEEAIDQAWDIEVALTGDRKGIGASSTPVDASPAQSHADGKPRYLRRK